MFRPVRSKYGNRSTYCRQGHYHPSIFEAEYCDHLAFLIKAGEIKSYVNQVRIPLGVNGVKICDHIVDFEVTTNDDKVEIHETKGYETPEWRIKYKLFVAIFPDIPYHVIKKDFFH
jgi:hypothetical protein